MSPDVFDALGVQPVLGRAFTAAEDKPGGPAVVMLSHGLWQSRFAGDPGIVNQTVALDGNALTVLGVMPDAFKFPGEASLWVPVQAGLADSDRQGRGERSLNAIARLKSGVTFKQARAAMDTIGARLAQQYPDANKNRHIGMELLLDSQVGKVRRALWILLGAVAVVLLIVGACLLLRSFHQRVAATLIGLLGLLALTLATVGLYGVMACVVSQRTREIGIRMALGAQFRDVLRLVIAQGMSLTAIGVGIGVVGALALSRVMQRLLFEVKPTDPLTFVIVSVMLLLVATLASWLPARRAAKVDPMEALRHE